MYNDDGNDNRIGRNDWGDRDDSFNYDVIDASMLLWYKYKLFLQANAVTVL